MEPERLGLQQGTMGNGKHVLAFLMRERNEFKPVHHLQPIIFISPFLETLCLQETISSTPLNKDYKSEAQWHTCQSWW